MSRCAKVEQRSSADVGAVGKTSNQPHQVHICVAGSFPLQLHLPSHHRKKSKKKKKTRTIKHRRDIHRLRLKGHLRYSCVHINRDG